MLVYALVEGDQLKAYLRRLARTLDLYSDPLLQRCRAASFNAAGRRVPLSWPDDPGFVWRLSADQRAARGAARAAEGAARAAALAREGAEAEQGLQALKLLEMDETLCSVLAARLAGGTGAAPVEVPFALAEGQREFADCTGSAMAIGRSGTGKTTALENKM
jgi:hypothetical protein